MGLQANNLKVTSQPSPKRGVSPNNVDGAIIVDEKLKVVHANEKARALLFELDEEIPAAVEKLIGRVLPEKSKFVVGQLIAHPLEYRGNSHLGDFWESLYVHAEPFSALGGIKSGHLVVFHDLHDVKAQYENFMGTIIHDLRSPLSAISGTLSVLMDELKAKGKGGDRELLEIMNDGCLRMDGLMEVVTDLTNFERGHLTMETQKFDLAILLRELVGEFKSLAKAQDTALDLQIRKSLWLYGDSFYLKKAFNALIHNALKFTNKGHVLVEGKVLSDCVEIRVQDTGPGIPPKQIASLFQRLKITGRGLGLPLAKHIVEAHRGIIKLTTDDISGTTMLIHLPKTKFKEIKSPTLRLQRSNR